MIRKLNVKENLEDIRYCVIHKNNSERSYDFVCWCDSALDARREAEEYSNSDFRIGHSSEEYWAFDTKKWKATLPLNFLKSDQTFDSNLPIYYVDDEGNVELLKTFINKIVYTAESYIKENRYGYVHDENEAKLEPSFISYLKRTGWVPINVDGTSYYTMDFNYGNMFCDIYISEWGNCYLVTDNDDLRSTDMFYTLTESDPYKVIPDLITLGNTVASTGDVSAALDIFFN